MLLQRSRGQGGLGGSRYLGGCGRSFLLCGLRGWPRCGAVRWGVRAPSGVELGRVGGRGGTLKAGSEVQGVVRVVVMGERPPQPPPLLLLLVLLVLLVASEAVPVASKLFPGSFAARLSSERPGTHHVDLDNRGEPHLESTNKKTRFRNRARSVT